MRPARTLLATSVVARLPLAMFSIALLVHVRQLTGSFAVAGAATGAYAAAVGVGGPLLGRCADRRGQTLPLLAAAGAAAGLLVALALLPAGAPAVLVVGLAGLLGLATPPVGPCARGLLPELVTDPGALRAAYAFECSALELTFIAGPPLALGLGALWSTGGALLAGGLLLLAATAAFALQPAARRRGPRPAGRRGGVLRSPGLRTLALVLGAAGVLFGAVEVGVTAAAGAGAGAAPLLALWGAGSLAGGGVASRLGGGARSGRGLVGILAALAAGHLALGAATGSAVALGGVLFLAGAAIAPTYASVYAMVDEVAPAGAITEAFAWLATATSVGAAAGAAAAGSLVDSAGPQAAFGLAGAAGALAVALALAGAASLPGAPLSPAPAR
jgi:predicted MFS family arabinose efflux permease